MAKWVQVTGDLKEAIAKVTCMKCKNYAWLDNMRPMQQMTGPFKLGIHHPACPNIRLD
jgi:hypothetical protein